MDATSLIVVPMVIGVVELIDRLFAQDHKAALKIVAAASVGALAGLFGLEGLNVATGIVLGLGASGVVTAAKRIGG